jgi:hypothetical protein
MTRLLDSWIIRRFLSAFSNWLKGLGLDLGAGYGFKQELLDFLESRGLTGELEKWEESLQVNERE